MQHGRDADHELLVRRARAAVAGMFSMRWALLVRLFFSWKALQPGTKPPEENRSILTTLVEGDKETEWSQLQDISAAIRKFSFHL
ncbi:hypothetical protein BT69DRAFT_891961 [Atractiella rhizophila]|nr:hypothetical protein BT69DRAFT_891961 [Atractiella rhizophila]